MVVPLIEDVHLPDIFVSGIARIERLDGACVRIVLYADQLGSDGTMERIVVARIVRPIATWALAIKQLCQALAGEDMLVAENGTVRPLN